MCEPEKFRVLLRTEDGLDIILAQGDDLRQVLQRLQEVYVQALLNNGRLWDTNIQI